MFKWAEQSVASAQFANVQIVLSNAWRKSKRNNNNNKKYHQRKSEKVKTNKWSAATRKHWQKDNNFKGTKKNWNRKQTENSQYNEQIGAHIKIAIRKET